MAKSLSVFHNEVQWITTLHESSCSWVSCNLSTHTFPKSNYETGSTGILPAQTQDNITSILEPCSPLMLRLCRCADKCLLPVNNITWKYPSSVFQPCRYPTVIQQWSLPLVGNKWNNTILAGDINYKHTLTNYKTNTNKRQTIYIFVCISWGFLI